MGIPIVQDGNAIGALFIGGAPGCANFSDAAEAALVALADYAAVAIHYQRQLKQQRSLTHGFVNLLERERRTVAYEVHDGITQHLMAANAFLDSYCDSRTKTDAAAAMNLEQAKTCLRIAVQESRRLINGLSALTLDDIGLPGSLRQLLNEQADLAGWKDADFIHNTGGRRYGVDLETAIYRIAQEALSNVRKHSGSDDVSVRLHEGHGDDGDKLLTLTVQDWGNGFDPRMVTSEYGHVGLRSMNERTKLLDGGFSVESAPGAGTRIIAVFELER
jgi:signal transduction histidine kinase